MKHTLRITRFLGGIFLLPQILHSSLVSAQLPAIPPAHIVILWEENYAYSDIIGSSYAPNINTFANDPNAALFTQFFAIEHPSQPNYLDMFSGSNQGLTSDDYPTSDGLTLPFTAPNLAAELIAAGLTFTTYSEDLPSVGSDVATYTTGGANYARKHNPCTNWSSALGSGANTIPETVNQPFSAFPNSSSYSSLPTVSFVAPNMTNDMHDGTYPSNITIGDTWMYNNLDNLRAWSLTNNTLYILIYDEDDDLHDNNIPVIFYGPMVKHGTYSNHETLVNILGTIETMYGLGHAGSPFTGSSITNDSTITYCWQNVTTGVKNVTDNNYTFKVTPNPASDIINFNCNTMLNSQVTIAISDATGRMMGKYTMTNKNLEVNTSAYAAGVYVYSIINDKGSKLDYGKFVITHN